MVASHTPPSGDLAHNPGMCPDQELNHLPFGSQASTQSPEPHQGSIYFFKIYILKYTGKFKEFSLQNKNGITLIFYFIYIYIS